MGTSAWLLFAGRKSIIMPRSATALIWIRCSLYDLPLIPELVTRPLRWESGAEAVQILLDERGLKPGVDFQAVVAVSDMLALWALKTLQARGYDVPAMWR